jgi:hypothetical protein
MDLEGLPGIRVLQVLERLGVALETAQVGGCVELLRVGSGAKEASNVGEAFAFRLSSVDEVAKMSLALTCKGAG